MSSATDFAQLCRLCLVKEQVNVDIFEEPDNIRQIFHKISTCLPVKLSKEDKLPKRICEGCLYKLNIAYQFWNTSVNAEKQLLQWLKQSTRKSEADFPEKVKEEIDVPGNEIENIEDFLETSLTDVNTGKSETCVENVPESSDDEPLAKRRRRLRAQTRAAPPKPAEVIVGKVELNETDGDDNSDDPDDPNYLPDGVDMSDDNEQPGPSGLGTSTSDIPVELILMDGLENTTCIKCNKTFESRRRYTRHRYRCITPKSIQCEFCTRMFRRVGEKNLHIRHDHGENKKIFPCDICDKTFRSKIAYENHKDSIHFNKYRYNCNECGQKFVTKIGLDLHVESKHRGIRYQCEYCVKSFSDKNYFKFHVESHQNSKIYKCKKCDKEFNNNGILRMHMRSEHYKRKSYVCEVCGKVLTTKESLKEHSRMHTGEKPYGCDVCGKRFAKRIVLKIHSRTHTNEKPYACKLCGNRFTQHTSMRIHMRQHSGDKPYCCSICQERFYTRTLLKSHSKKHGVPLDQ